MTADVRPSGLLALAIVVMTTVGCASAAGPAGTTAPESAPPAATGEIAQPPADSTTPAPDASALPTRPTGPGIVASDPSEWDELTLCLNRTLLVPEGHSLADMRRVLLEIAPERVARLQLDREASTLTVVPAAGAAVTESDLRTALAAVADTDADGDTALAAVSIAAPDGRSFAEQCAVYAEVSEMMQQQNELGAPPADAPLITSLGLDLGDGIVSVGVTEPAASEFVELAAQTDLVELYFFPISHG